MTTKQIIRIIIKAFKNGNKILIFGCGGSAAEASHFAAEFIGKGFPAISLTDSASITSRGNDLTFSEIFSRQILALGKKGDIAIGLSTSGTSESVVNGLKQAKDIGLIAIDWPRNRKKRNEIDTQRIQEYQLRLIHNVYLEVDKYFNK